MALFTNIEIARPTVIILLSAALADTGSKYLRALRDSADSLSESLKPVVTQHGYVIEIRAIQWAAIHDRGANAHYAAASDLRGLGLVIVAPGFAPRLLRF